ncbi:PRPSAP1 [Cordylochernes scorpioides]|uniref:PRPSAP1 n=1 Tax=Cordylochernes scorpioides TaxID=51811 RepID=A0ABY6KYG3_9ARAC|nr:PRPSAP1 [Cordylochernes scorpioides]
MELLIMAYACKTSSARKIVGVLPYLPYSKQSKMRKRGCIVSKLLAKMMCKAGLTHLITMDLHQKEVQGFFDIPVDNLRASPFLLQYIQEAIPDYRNAVIVARDPGSAKKATSYAERLRLGIAVIHGEQKESEQDMVDGRYSPPVTGAATRTMDVGLDLMPVEIVAATRGLCVPVLAAKEKPPINVVGDVGGRIAIMVDDMIDDVRSFVAAAEVLKDRGAYKIYLLATHGLLSSDAPQLIEDSPIDEVTPFSQSIQDNKTSNLNKLIVVVTNTVPHEVQKMQCNKIKTVDISILLSEAIRRIHNKESMSYLFRNVTLED